MSGLGYSVVAEIAFKSNGVEVMRSIAQSVQRATVSIDLQTQALLKNSAAWSSVARAARAATAAQAGAAGAARDVADTMSRTAAATSAAARGYDDLTRSARAAASAIVVTRTATSWSGTGSRGATLRALASDATIVAPAALNAARSLPMLALSGGGSGGGSPPIARAATGGEPTPAGGRAAWGAGGGGGGMIPPRPPGWGFGSMGPAWMPPPATTAFLKSGLMFGTLAGVGLEAGALTEAAKLQRNLTRVSAAGGTPQQVGQLRDLAYVISNATAQSVVQSAGTIATAVSAGITPQQMLAKDKNGQTFAEIAAKFADVQFLKSGVPFDTGTRELVQLAHLYRTYTPQGIEHIADQVTKLSFMMPDNLQRYLTQSSYYVPLLSRLGVPQDESLVMGAFLDRMGLGRGKGGTSLQNFTMALMKPAMLTGSRGGAQLTGMKELGLYDAHRNPNPGIFRSDAAGNLVTDPLQALKMIATTIADKTRNLRGPAKAREEMQLIGDFQKSFGIQGQRFGLLGDATGIGQLVGMAARLPQMPDVVNAQGMFMQNLGGRRCVHSRISAHCSRRSAPTNCPTQRVPSKASATFCTPQRSGRTRTALPSTNTRARCGPTS